MDWQFEKVIPLTPSNLDNKNMKIIGTFREVDIRDGKGKCFIESPFLGMIKCTYPPELESQICSFFAPPRSDIIVEGEMITNVKTGKYKELKIAKISKPKTLFDEQIEPTNWKKYWGAFKDIEPDKSADDITDWMIETLWGKDE